MNRALAGLWLVVMVVMVAACGAPQFTYVSNSSAHAYFKVPAGWRKLSDSALAAVLRGGSSGEPTGVWSVGYDGSSSPSASHVFGSVVPQPFAFALVEPLNSTASAGMSYNGLRDVFLPVTSATRATAAKSGFPLTGFHLLRNDVLTQGQGVHGAVSYTHLTLPTILRV